MTADTPTPDEAARIQRVLGYCDGWADLWSEKEGIRGQIERMLGKSADPRWIDALLKWSKQAYGEGCYFGYKEAQDFVNSLMAPLLEDVRRICAMPDWEPRATAPKDRPIQTWDGQYQAVVEWDERLQDFALAPDSIFMPDPRDAGADHRIEWEFTHWHDLREPPK